MHRLLRYSGIFAIETYLDIFVDFLRLMTVQVDRVYYRRRPPDHTPYPDGTMLYSRNNDDQDEEETYFDANSSCPICINEQLDLEIPFDYHWAPHEQILNRAHDNNTMENRTNRSRNLDDDDEQFEDSSDILPDQYSALYIEHDNNPSDIQEEVGRHVEEPIDGHVENDNLEIDFEPIENELEWEHNKKGEDDGENDTCSIDSHVENNNIELDFGTTPDNCFDYHHVENNNIELDFQETPENCFDYQFEPDESYDLTKKNQNDHFGMTPENNFDYQFEPDESYELTKKNQNDHFGMTPENNFDDQFESEESYDLTNKSQNDHFGMTPENNFDYQFEPEESYDLTKKSQNDHFGMTPENQFEPDENYELTNKNQNDHFGMTPENQLEPDETYELTNKNQNDNFGMTPENNFDYQFEPEENYDLTKKSQNDHFGMTPENQLEPDETYELTNKNQNDHFGMTPENQLEPDETYELTNKNQNDHFGMTPENQFEPDESYGVTKKNQNDNFEMTPENNFDCHSEPEKNRRSMKNIHDDENNNSKEYEDERKLTDFNTQINTEEVSEEVDSNFGVREDINENYNNKYEWLEGITESDKESQLINNNLNNNHSNIETNNTENINLIEKFQQIFAPSNDKYNRYLDNILNAINDVKQRNDCETNVTLTESNVSSAETTSKCNSNTFDLSIAETKKLISNIKDYLKKKRKKKSEKRTKKHCEINNNVENSNSNVELHRNGDASVKYKKSPLVSKNSDENTIHISNINIPQIGKHKKLNVPESSISKLGSNACKFKHFKKVIILKENARIQEQMNSNCTETSSAAYNFQHKESIAAPQIQSKFNEENMNQINNNLEGCDINERENVPATCISNKIFWEEPDIELARKFCEVYNSSSETSSVSEVTKSSSERVGVDEFFREPKRSKKRRKRKHELEALSEVDDPTYEPTTVKRANLCKINRPKRRTSIFKSYSEEGRDYIEGSTAQKIDTQNDQHKSTSYNCTVTREPKVGIILKINKDSQEYSSSLLE